MSTGENHASSVFIPIFSGTTTDFKRWQIQIRDYSVQLELEDFLLQEIRFPNAAYEIPIRVDGPPLFRPIQRPAFPAETASTAAIRFFELRLKAYQEERSRIIALRNKIVSSISTDIYLQLFSTDLARLNAGPDHLYSALETKFRHESAADIASEAASALKGIENGNFEAFLARQKTYIRRCSEGGQPMTNLQQVEQLCKALEGQREINIKTIRDFFYDAFPEREDQTFDRLLSKVRNAWNNRTAPVHRAHMAVTAHVAAVNARAMTPGEIKLSIRELQQEQSKRLRDDGTKPPHKPVPAPAGVAWKPGKPDAICNHPGHRKPSDHTNKQCHLQHPELKPKKANAATADADVSDDEDEY
jgi:hypothetical protein